MYGDISALAPGASAALMVAPQVAATPTAPPRRKGKERTRSAPAAQQQAAHGIQTATLDWWARFVSELYPWEILGNHPKRSRAASEFRGGGQARRGTASTRRDVKPLPRAPNPGGGTPSSQDATCPADTEEEPPPGCAPAPAPAHRRGAGLGAPRLG